MADKDKMAEELLIQKRRCMTALVTAAACRNQFDKLLKQDWGVQPIMDKIDEFGERVEKVLERVNEQLEEYK